MDANNVLFEEYQALASAVEEARWNVSRAYGDDDLATAQQELAIASYNMTLFIKRVLEGAREERDQSLKADGGKVRLELVPPEAILAIGRVMTHGAEKYGALSYREVEPERYIGALLRHFMAYLEGEEIDPDSGLKHIEQVLCNAAFLVDLGYQRERKGGE